jgi:transposase
LIFVVLIVTIVRIKPTETLFSKKLWEYTASSPRYCQMIRGPNKEKRVHFCNQLVTSNDNFADVIFTDECTVQLHDNKVVVYCLIDEAAPPIPKPKHAFRVHVWGGISHRGTTRHLIFDGIPRSSFFVDKILRQTLLPFMDAVYPDGHRFQQNNNPKHRSALFKDFMSTNQINWWEDWPSESPDLNPIEMVWNLMKCRLAKKSLQTKEDLEAALQEFWSTDLTVEHCNCFIDHLYKVLPTVIAVQGRATADLPRKIFPERSRGKSIQHFNIKLDDPAFNKQIKHLLPH